MAEPLRVYLGAEARPGGRQGKHSADHYPRLCLRFVLYFDVEKKTAADFIFRKINCAKFNSF